MIVAEQKPLEEIQRMLKGKKKVLAVGCGTCVSVCFTGGKKETGALAATLRTAAAANGQELEVEEATVQRQCVQEFIQPLDTDVGEYDAVLSMACGVGVQTLAERYPETRILPGLDTNFMGQPTEPGIWEERCVGCGHCVLEYTGGLCPITRCPKQLMNGPCGGSENGMCEVDPSIPCIWAKIWDRVDNLGLIDELMEIQPPKDWTKSRGGSMRRVVVRDDVHQPFGVTADPRMERAALPATEAPGPEAATQAFIAAQPAAAPEPPADAAAWTKVCALDEIPERRMKKFEVDSVGVMIANLGDCLRAFPPTCPHMAEPLAESGQLEGDMLTCTKHIWQWDLRTGALCGMAERPVLTYPVKQEDGAVFVSIEKEIEYEYDEDEADVVEEDEPDDDDFFNA